MSILKEIKDKIISSFATKEGDTGSVEVQVGILTERIKNLTEHLKSHKKDYSCRKGLMILVARKKRLLDYLKKESETRYKALLEKIKK